MIDSKTMDALLSGQIYVLLFYIFFLSAVHRHHISQSHQKKKMPVNEPQLFMISMVLEILNLNVSKERE